MLRKHNKPRRRWPIAPAAFANTRVYLPTVPIPNSHDVCMLFEHHVILAYYIYGEKPIFVRLIN